MASDFFPSSSTKTTMTKRTLPLESKDKENQFYKKPKLDILNPKDHKGALLDKKHPNVVEYVKSDCDLEAYTKAKYFVSTSQVSREALRRKSLRLIQRKWGFISPIPENKYAPLSIIIHQGIPVDRQHIAKKTSLFRSRFHVQDNLQEYYDDFYSMELLEDITNYLLSIQHQHILNTDFLKTFNSCCSSRCSVINWLIQAQEYFSLPYQQILTVVYLFDFVISKTKVSINMYQLVGVTILWIISKTDSLYFLTVSQILAICREAYTKQQLLKMERKLLIFFDFKVNITHVTIFVTFFMKKLNIAGDVLNILLFTVHYVLECFALNPTYSTYFPYMKAAAAVLLVIKLLIPNKVKDVDLLKKHMGLDNLQSLENEMLVQIQLVQDPGFANRQPYIKYSKPQYCKASLLILESLVAS